MIARAIRWVCVILAAHMGAGSPAARWLVIAGSSAEVNPVIKIEKRLGTSWPQALIVASQDCSNLSPGLYLAVMSITSDRSMARNDVSRLKSDIPDAYVKDCVVKPGSPMAFGISAVDRSIENVPNSAVNWTDADRLSQVVALPESGHLWIRRSYMPDPDDAREGQRVSVLFFRESPSEARLLEADCSHFQYAQRGNRIAISCAREIAADNVLHTTDVFAQPNLSKLISVERCRDPRFLSETEMNCAEEHVGVDGRLQLVPKKVHF